MVAFPATSPPIYMGTVKAELEGPLFSLKPSSEVQKVASFLIRLQQHQLPPPPPPPPPIEVEATPLLQYTV